MKTLLTGIIFLLTLTLSGCGQAEDLATIDSALIEKDGWLYTKACAENPKLTCAPKFFDEAVTLAETFFSGDKNERLQFWKKVNGMETSDIGLNTKLRPNVVYVYTITGTTI